MAEVWVLDTETKGTGANMVPLERVLRKGSEAVPGFLLPARRRPDARANNPRPRHRFKVVDLMTRQDLADDVDARGAVVALEPARSIVDVIVYVREPDQGEWRRLTFAELKSLWERRGRIAPPSSRSSRA